ncbi:phosphoenolpyruvate carboxykinase [Candidatus Micrarchaeota archaeon]|nr:phosphoenolpyruvate carboxykinase [Candidatus Micrarchaeota archaeon]
MAAEAAHKCRITSNPGIEKLREMARPDEQTTEYGSANYITSVRSRSAKFTEIVFTASPQQEKMLAEVSAYLDGKELIAIDRIMCLRGGYETPIRLFVTKKFARLAYMWGRMLFVPAKEVERPEFTIIDIPEWPERKVLVDPKNFITFILGSDYCGEIKKAGLRMVMYAHKTKRGGLGLHAGSKILRVLDAGGRGFIEKGVLLFGLSATGKTTLTCHHHWLDASKGERVRIRQDDIVLLNRDSSAVGTEDNFYIKTDGLEPDSQPLLYKGATSPNAILENVKVDGAGRVDFFDSSITSNGRGVVIRKELDFTDASIDLERVDMMVFITRRKTIVPPIARLNPEQAAAFFMLGESVESSAGDPAQAGRPLRVVGTNPFIIGPLEEEGNRFLEILRANPHIECYLLSTGACGAHPGVDDGVKITVYDSARLLADAARGAIKWETDPDWGYEVAAEVGDVDMRRFDPERHYSENEYRRLTEELKAERRAWLGQFKGLKREIAGAV